MCHACCSPGTHLWVKLGSYEAAKMEVMPKVEHRKHKRLNNRAENSHQPTRHRERGYPLGVATLQAPSHAQRFLSAFDQSTSTFACVGIDSRWGWSSWSLAGSSARKKPHVRNGGMHVSFWLDTPFGIALLGGIIPTAAGGLRLLAASALVGWRSVLSR